MDIYGGQDCDNDPGKQSPEVGQDLADVMAAGAEHGEDGIAKRAFQWTSGQAAIGFHVTDLSLDGASATQVGDQFWRQAAAHSADQDAGLSLTMATIATVNDRQLGTLVCEDCHLLKGPREGVAIVGRTWEAAHAHHKALV